MLLKDVLCLPVFKSATPLYLGDGENNKIESTMVLEAIDVEYWGRQNELILTSFYALEGLSDSEIELFFTELAAVPIAGLVIKINRLIHKIPNLVINLCKKYDIPLIKITESIRYKDIMTAIYQPLLNKQNHILKTYYDASNVYNKLPLVKVTFEEIIQKMNLLVKKNIKLNIPAKNIDIFINNKDNPTNLIKIKEEILNSQYSKKLYTLTTFFNPETKEDYYEIDSTVKNSIVSDFTIKIYSESFQDYELESDLMIVEKTVQLIRQKLQVDHLLQQETYIQKNNLAISILLSTSRSVEEHHSLLNKTGMSANSHFKLVGLKKETEGIKMIKNISLNHLKSLNLPYVYYEHDKYFIMIFNIMPNEEKLSKEYLNKFLPNEVIKNLVISSESTSGHINDLYNECIDLFKFKEEFEIPNIISTEDLGVFRYVSHLDKNQIMQIIPLKLIELYENDFELFNTLYQFMKNDRNYNDTAKHLYLHPKTIRYRLDKIMSILNVNFDDSFTFTNYFVYLNIIKLDDRNYETKLADLNL